MMRYPILHTFFSCLISLVYPIFALVFRDAVVIWVFFGTLFLGVWRYAVGLGGILHGECSPDFILFLFRPCKGKIGLLSLLASVVAVILFAVAALLPVRIFLDFSMPLAKIALFFPFVYCAVTSVLFMKKINKNR